MENPIKMDDLGVPLFSETPIWKHTHYLRGNSASLWPFSGWWVKTWPFQRFIKRSRIESPGTFLFHHFCQTSKFYHSIYIYIHIIYTPVFGGTQWWLQTFFIFTPSMGNDPIWQIFFNWVETTKQPKDSGWSKFNFNMWKLFASGPFPCWKAFSGVFRESIDKSMGRKTIGRYREWGVFFQVPRALFDGVFIDILY